MVEFSYTIKDPLGIHARPGSLIIRKIQEFNSKAVIICGDGRCDGNKLLALMKMRVKAGDTITMQFEGSDEEDAAIVLEKYISEVL